MTPTEKVTHFAKRIAGFSPEEHISSRPRDEANGRKWDIFVTVRDTCFKFLEFERMLEGKDRSDEQRKDDFILELLVFVNKLEGLDEQQEHLRAQFKLRHQEGI
jgi:hypothetical protein